MVEPDRPHLSRWPELHVALRAAAKRGVGRHHHLAAPLAAAAVAVAGDDAGAAQRETQHLLELHAVGHHRAVGRREDEVRRRRVNRHLEEGNQLLRGGEHVGVPALRRVAVVGAGDGDEAQREIDHRLVQPEELALAHPGVQRGREERAPLRRERSHDERDLVELEVVGHAARDLALLHVDDGVLADEPLLLLRRGERAQQVAAEVVQRPLAQLLALGCEELLDVPGRHVDERELSELGVHEVAPDRADARLVGRLVLEVLREPPLHESADRSATIGRRHGLESPALALGLELELVREPLGLGLGGGRRPLAHPLPGRILEPEVPGATFEVGGGHG